MCVCCVWVGVCGWVAGVRLSCITAFNIITEALCNCTSEETFSLALLACSCDKFGRRM